MLADEGSAQQDEHVLACDVFVAKVGKKRLRTVGRLLWMPLRAARQPFMDGVLDAEDVTVVVVGQVFTALEVERRKGPSTDNTEGFEAEHLCRAFWLRGLLEVSYPTPGLPCLHCPAAW